jgi:hypothetical protein
VPSVRQAAHSLNPAKNNEPDTRTVYLKDKQGSAVLKPGLVAAIVLWFAVFGGWFHPAAAQRDVPPEIAPYLHARSVVDFSFAELVKCMPELKNLDFAQTQEPLDPILKKVGENAKAFFENYPNTSALEDVYFEREEPGGVVDQYHKLKFYYIITAHNSEDELGLEEYRTTLKDERINLSDLKGAYLLTSGHASASLHFHPRLSAGCRFRYLGREKKNPQAHVIAFSQNPEKTRTWGTINLLGNEAAILKQGAVWVDPGSYQILRMRSDLLGSRSDVGLEQHTGIIDFSECRFDGSSRTLWLPREVRLVIKFKGWKFTNQHRYSQYRLFTVNSIDGPKIIKKQP